jgi:hypothetical protein
VDGVRLTAAAAAFAVGCGGAEADPGRRDAAAAAPAHEPRHGIDVPAAWRELPAAAAAAITAARGVLGDGSDVHAHAWGEPALGCYLAIVEARGAARGAIDTIAAELEAALTEPGGVEITEWLSSPDAEDRSEIHARFTRGSPPIRGQLRAELVLDSRRIPHAVAAACFYNDRHPAACDHACTPLLTMLARLEPPPPPS